MADFARGAQFAAIYETTKSNNVAPPGKYVGNLRPLAAAWRTRRCCQMARYVKKT